MSTPPHRPARSSRQQYREFVEAFRTKQLDSEGQAGGPPGAAKSAARRAHLREYLRWLRPHRTMAVAVFLLALVGAGLQMVEPLFLRYIIDRVLLVSTYTTAEKALRLHLAGATFLTVIIVSNVLGVIKDYRQRMLNTHVMLDRKSVV